MTALRISAAVAFAVAAAILTVGCGTSAGDSTELTLPPDLQALVDDLPIQTPDEVAEAIIRDGEWSGFHAEFCINLVTYGEAASYDSFLSAFGRSIVHNAYGRDPAVDPRPRMDEAFAQQVFVALADRCP